MCDYNISGDGVASFIDGEVVSVFVLFFVFITSSTVTAVVVCNCMIIICEIDLNF